MHYWLIIMPHLWNLPCAFKLPVCIANKSNKLQPNLYANIHSDRSELQ